MARKKETTTDQGMLDKLMENTGKTPGTIDVSAIFGDASNIMNPKADASKNDPLNQWSSYMMAQPGSVTAVPVPFMYNPWEIHSFDPKSDSLIPSKIEFNTERIKPGDICSIWITAKNVQLQYINTSLKEVTSDKLVFDVIDPITNETTELIITPDHLVEYEKRQFRILKTGINQEFFGGKTK